MTKSKNKNKKKSGNSESKKSYVVSIYGGDEAVILSGKTALADHIAELIDNQGFGEADIEVYELGKMLDIQVNSTVEIFG